MKVNERIRILNMNQHLAALGTAALRQVATQFDEIVVCAGTCVAVEGRLCHQFIVVADGRLKTQRGRCVQELVAGGSLGWKAMHTRGVHETTAVAVTEARLLVMSHAQFGAVAELPRPKPSPFSWALPSSRRPLPHRQHLERA